LTADIIVDGLIQIIDRFQVQKH